MDRKDQIMMDAADKCLEALDAADRAGDAIQTIEPREPRIALHEFYSYWRMDADAAGADPDHAPEDELTRAELLERLDGHVIDPAMAVADLEANAGVWTRLTSFAFYRAVYEPEPAPEPPYTRGEELPGSYRPGSMYDDGALDDDGAEAEELPDRIHKRFPIYVQTLLVRNIAIACYLPDLTIADLDQWTDAELANKALSYLPRRQYPTDADRRRNSYVRILATALRHFQDDPAKVTASILVVKMIAETGNSNP